MWRVALLAALVAGCRTGATQGSPAGERPEPAAAPSGERTSPAREAPSTDEPAPSAVPPAAAAAAMILLPLQLHQLTTDITMTRGGAKPAVFSYRDWARAAFARDLAELKGPDPDLPLTIRELDVTVLAWLGSFVSFEEKTMTTTPEHEAHPSGDVGYVTLRIEPTPAKAARVTLRDLFDDAALYRALLHEPTVRRRLPGGDAPANLADLLHALEEAPSHEGCSFDAQDLLGRFAFGKASGKSIAIELGLPGSGACRYKLTKITLHLATPKALRQGIDDMARGAGFTLGPPLAGTSTVHLRMTSEELGFRAAPASRAAPAPSASAR